MRIQSLPPFGNGFTQFNPQQSVVLYDDFIGASAVNSLGWTEVNSGTGADASTSSTGADETTIGLWQVETGTTNTGRSSLITQSGGVVIPGGSIECSMRIYIPVASNGTDQFAVYVGMGDQSGAGDMTDGAYFIYYTGVTPNWIISNAASSTRTATVTGTAVAIASWVNLTVKVNAEGTAIDYFVNGSNVGSITTNIPTVNQRTGLIFKIEKDIGTTSSVASIDYFKFAKTFNATR